MILFTLFLEGLILKCLSVNIEQDKLNHVSSLLFGKKYTQIHTEIYRHEYLVTALSSISLRLIYKSYIKKPQTLVNFRAKFIFLQKLFYKLSTVDALLKDDSVINLSRINHRVHLSFLYFFNTFMYLQCIQIFEFRRTYFPILHNDFNKTKKKQIKLGSAIMHFVHWRMY